MFFPPLMEESARNWCFTTIDENAVCVAVFVRPLSFIAVMERPSCCFLARMVFSSSPAPAALAEAHRIFED